MLGQQRSPSGRDRRDWNTVAVPYNPEMAKGVSPNPTGGGEPKNTASVTNTPIEKP
jgi:hypothetical protein